MYSVSQRHGGPYPKLRSNTMWNGVQLHLTIFEFVFDFTSAKFKISSRTAAGGRRWSIAAPQAAQASYPSAALALFSTWATGTAGAQRRRRRGSIPAQVLSPRNFVSPFAYFTCWKGPYWRNWSLSRCEDACAWYKTTNRNQLHSERQLLYYSTTAKRPTTTFD